MKLLHVIPSFAPAWRYGGPIYAALAMTKELVRQGHSVAVMTTNIDGPGVLNVPLGRPVVMDGVEVWYFPVESPRWWCFSQGLWQALKEQVRNVDLVHIHSVFLWPTTAASFWCRKYGIPYIIRPAGALDPVCLNKTYEPWWRAWPSRTKKWVWLKTLGRVELNHAAGIHCTSQAELEALLPLQLKAPGFVVPLGVDIPSIAVNPGTHRLPDRYPQLAGKKVILFLSRLDPKKGLELLIPALGLLAAKRKDFALVIAGDGTPRYQAEVVRPVRKHGLEQNVVFLGSVYGDAKWALLQESDVLVLPSYQENFGIAVAEAMARGIPVVISRQVGLWKEVRQAEAGLVVGLDKEELADALDRLLEDEALRQRMGTNGARYAHKHLMWDQVVRELIRRYKQILTGSLSSEVEST